MILIEVSAIFDHVGGRRSPLGASGHCHRVVLSGKLGNNQPIRLSAGLRKGANMDIEIHAPSMLVLVVSLALAVLALVCYFVVTPDNMHVAFWISIMAYVVGALGTTVKT